MRTLATTAVVLLGMCAVSSATTIHVDWAGGGDYLTIREGVTAADEGDTVLVADGTYSGSNIYNIQFGGTNIVLMSETGAENTIIDGGQTDWLIAFYGGEDTTSVVDGFTLANSTLGISMSESAATIRNCIFHDNVSTSNGGAMFCGFTTPDPVISNCIFYDNRADNRGGAIFCDRSSAKFRDCIFYRNSVEVGGGTSSYGGGAINVHYASPPATIKRCTFVDNSSVVGGGGIHVQSGDGANISECVVALSTEGKGIDIDSGAGSVSNCIIFGNAGGDSLYYFPENLYVDPLLCDVYADDFSLCSNSPCLSGNNAWGVQVGALGQDCGYCEAAVEPSTWGSVKALLR